MENNKIFQRDTKGKSIFFIEGNLLSSNTDLNLLNSSNPFQSTNPFQTNTPKKEIKQNGKTK
jgi:hypothetical protein